MKKLLEYWFGDTGTGEKVDEGLEKTKIGNCKFIQEINRRLGLIHGNITSDFQHKRASILHFATMEAAEYTGLE